MQRRGCRAAQGGRKTFHQLCNLCANHHGKQRRLRVVLQGLTLAFLGCGRVCESQEKHTWAWRVGVLLGKELSTNILTS